MRRLLCLTTLTALAFSLTATAATFNYPDFNVDPVVYEWNATTGIAAGDTVVLATGALYTSSASPITTNGTLEFAVSGNSSINNKYDYTLGMTGTGNVIVSAGVVDMTGTNSYSGGTAINFASLYGTPSSLQGNFINDGTLGFLGATSGTFTGNVSGNGILQMLSTGTVTWAGTNTLSAFGRIRAEYGQFVGSTANLRGEIECYNTATVVFDQTTSGTFEGRFFDPAAPASFGNVVKTGTADMTWTANNLSAYTGNTLQIQQGRLIGPAQSMNINGTVTIAGGAEMVIDEPIGGSVYAMSTTIDGAGSVVKTGSGTVDMTTMNNDYSGLTTVAQGKLLYTPGSLPFSVVSGSFGAIAMTGSGSSNTAGIGIYVTGISTEYDYPALLSGAGSLTVAGNGTLLLTGSNTYSGGTFVETGRVAGSTQTMPGPVTLLGDGVVVCDVEYRQNFDASVSYPISGIGGIYKSGSGTLTLSASSSVAGFIDVEAGRLVVNGAMPNIARTIVEENATLMGSGTLGSNQPFFIGIEVRGNGTLSPGNSPGIITTNDLDLQGQSSTIWELVANTASPAARGTSFDGVDLTNGNLTIAQNAELDLVFNAAGSSVNWFNGLWDTNQSWVLIDNVVNPSIQDANVFTTITTSLDSVGGDISSLRPGAAFTLSVSNNDLLINYASAPLVPEPSTVAAGLTAALAGFVMLKRRQRSR